MNTSLDFTELAHKLGVSDLHQDEQEVIIADVLQNTSLRIHVRILEKLQGEDRVRFEELAQQGNIRGAEECAAQHINDFPLFVGRVCDEVLAEYLQGIAAEK